jgi:hypothetical protein
MLNALFAPIALGLLALTSGLFELQGNIMKEYRQHYKTERLSRRAEAAWGFILALAIGVGLAWLLVAWWSS